jgi:peptidoglycan-associated lipoprotein
MSLPLRSSLVALALVGSACAHSPKLENLSVRVDQTLQNVCSMVSQREPLFELNSTQLSSQAQQSLDTLAFCLTEGPMRGRTLQLTGHTDPQGPQELNRDLGFERADSVARYLELKGVKRSHLVVMSRGEEDASLNPSVWPKDRIVDLKVVN